MENWRRVLGFYIGFCGVFFHGETAVGSPDSFDGFAFFSCAIKRRPCDIGQVEIRVNGSVLLDKGNLFDALFAFPVIGKDHYFTFALVD